jgi:hypothetical protein
MRWTAGVRFPAEERDVSHRPDRLCGPPNLLPNAYRGLFPVRVKRSVRESDHSSPSSADVKNDGSMPPLIKHTDNFTFFINMLTIVCLLKFVSMK